MKFYPINISQIIDKVNKSELTAILLYGPDNGMVSELCKKIASTLALQQNLHKFESTHELFAVLNNMNFFSKKELIKIHYNSTKLDQETQNILSSNNINFPLLIAEELAPSSPLRKFFEIGKNLAAIACYPDEEKSIKQIILAQLQDYHKQISGDGLNFLLQNLHGDRLLIKSELEKLLCYIGDEQKISLEQCQSVISSSIEPHPDQLCIHFASKKGEAYLNELNNLFENAISPIWVLRSLARFYQNLLKVKLQEIDGVSIENSMSSLKPPIFFKYIQAFREIAHKQTLKEVSDALYAITNAEIEIKNSKTAESVMDNLFIKQFSKPE